MTSVALLSPMRWLSESSMGLISLLITGYIAHKEYQKRKSENVKTTFTTKWLKIYSFLCILSAPFTGFFIATLHLNGTCYFAWYLFGLFTFYQPLFMGFYQISRLYYCFARTQVYSDKGYPKWLYTIMFGSEIISLFMVPSFLLFTSAKRDVCGINAKWQSYVHYYRFPTENEDSRKWYLICLAIGCIKYLIWDITTLLLYVCKIRSFKKYRPENVDGNQNKKIHDRIACVMNRIVIMTLFYQIMAAVLGVVVIVMNIYFFRVPIEWIAGCVMSFCYSVSMYLMLDHNTKEYVQFLRGLKAVQMQYICFCGCGSVIISQLSMLDTKSDEKMISNSNVERKSSTEVTEYETHDISANHGEVVMNEMELSCQTP